MKQRLVVVSNRLPITVTQKNDTWGIAPASGGLITALKPLMIENEGVWIGWPGCGPEAPFESLGQEFSNTHKYHLKAVPLTEEDVEKYYRGFSNEALWPLFHDLLGYCNFDLANYQTYVDVNRRFAEVTAASTTDDDIIWFHDYQLILSGAFMRQLEPGRSLAFFLHIPFPSPDLFRRLPWAREILKGLLAYDLIGFQTLRDHRNFVHCVTSFFKEVKVANRSRRRTRLAYGGRTVSAGHFPISIDYGEFSEAAEAKEVSDAAWTLHENYGQRQLFLGLDRLDYTKGIPDRFLAFERALDKYPEMRQKASLIQVVIPSRTMVPDYIDLKSRLDQLAGRINSKFSQHGWVPLHYHYRSLDPVQLLAHYRAAEIALVTPLRDGMNLVAKEFCASNNDTRGVLVLSKFAGAADQLGKYALMVNPYDIEDTADMIYQAFTMSETERFKRMSQLRSLIRRNDVQNWLHEFVGVLTANNGNHDAGEPSGHSKRD